MPTATRISIILLAFVVTCSTCDDAIATEYAPKSTDVAYEYDDRLLLFSTLDGGLHAVEQQTGKKKWSIQDRPVVQVPVNTTGAILPLFLPDPRDGSLYLLGDSREPLKKLPFTIPQLVAASPCRSSDGILYTGKKKDVWFALDPSTGRRHHILSWDEVSPSTCPLQSPDAVYVGRTQYSVMMVDSANANRRWNVSFYDYAASPIDRETLVNYNLAHFSSSSTGRLLTMDSRSGSLLWQVNFGSTVVSAYLLDPTGLLLLPLTGLADNTLDHLATHLLTHQQPFETQAPHMKLYPTLYVGEHRYGLYAVPSLVDQNAIKITAMEAGPLLLDGPDVDIKSTTSHLEYPIPGRNYHLKEGQYDVDLPTLQSVVREGGIGRNLSLALVGYYNVPSYAPSKLMITGETYSRVEFIATENPNLNVDDFTIDNRVVTSATVGVQTDFDENETITGGKENGDVHNAHDFVDVFKKWYKHVENFVDRQENKGLKLLLIVCVGCIIAMFWYLQMQVREFHQWSRNGSRSSDTSASSGVRTGSMTAALEELPDGLVRVGKIVFHPDVLLGKGCEGTFVYRGEFDKRMVAVKRLLPECFDFADREVELLRESDAHPNVVRYYCTEQDRMFRYIALELCQATLHDYMHGERHNGVTALQILQQATAGLAHLHSLGIVHRDIKPQNVLLSIPNSKGEVRAMISDFGLCKKLQVGRMSFSRRSGVTGTDGWIAPEMLKGGVRTTCAVDLFSLGCVYYFVLSEAGHPFGDALRRQANILAGDSDISGLRGQPWHIAIQKPLLEALISSEPGERPCCTSVLSHPIFWNGSMILSFFQDVSDRVEKAEPVDPVLELLEHGSSPVVRRDWRSHIDDEMATDLRKYRSYNGTSVRDLLRALRNKKHHYRELSPAVQETLGETPDAFVNYWLSRFPLLLLHVWHAMQCVALEKTFSHYYPSSYRFPLRVEHAKREEENDDVYTPEDFRNRNVLFRESSKRKESPGKGYGASKRRQKFHQTDKFKKVGLYRNVDEDGGEALQVEDNAPTKWYSTRKKSFGDKSMPKKKCSKTPDEPLLWAVSLNKQK